MDGQLGDWVDGWVVGWMNNGWLGGQMDAQIDGWMGEWMAFICFLTLSAKRAQKQSTPHKQNSKNPGL